MSVAYLALGAIGYWSQGRCVQEIIIFGTGFDTWSRIAAGAILFQVILLYGHRTASLAVNSHRILVSRAHQSYGSLLVRLVWSPLGLQYSRKLGLLRQHISWLQNP